MNSQPVFVNSTQDSQVNGAERAHFRGRRLLFARIGWLLISLSAISLFVTALVWNTRAWWNYTEAGCSAELQQGKMAFERCVADFRAHEQVFGTMQVAALYYGVGAAVEIVPWVLVGFLIFWRRSYEPFAFFFSLGLVLTGTLEIDGAIRDIIWNNFPFLRLLIKVLRFLGAASLVLWYCFPNGQFAPRRTRWMAAVWILLAFFTAFLAGSPLSYYTWPHPLPEAIEMIFVVSLVLSLVYRYRYVSVPAERQQIRWIVVTGAFFGCIYAGNIPIMNWAVSHRGLADTALTFVIIKTTYLPLIYLGSAVFATGIGISILRYRLWDIDILINRTLVYGALTAIVIAIYVIVVGALGTIIQGRVNLLTSMLAIGLVAVLVQPLRDRLQRGVNRMMYGERDDPVTVLSRLGQRLEATLAPDAVLPSLVETVAQTLKLPYVAIETMNQRSESQPTADSVSISLSAPTIAYGKPQPDVVRLPLIYQSETIGQLVVAPRAPGESLSPMDRHLLENIAHQAGMAVHAVSLTADLQRSRQRLVTAREEERRRLRRDLHDGLGPNLASQGLKLAAIKQLLEKDPTSAFPLIDQVMAQNKSTVAEVRRLVYDLRPPALDELGLIAAVRDHVAAMDGKSTLKIEVQEPSKGLPSLSAAVEVAAYRIILEALTNVIRHAQAQHCWIRFSQHRTDLQSFLDVQIQDDGIGLPEMGRAGVGTRSMRERAEELGGTCAIESSIQNGTRVHVQIPLRAG
jgi:signal transduction histidine kinase